MVNISPLSRFWWAPVCGLLYPCCPVAISLGIAEVVVPSLYGHSGRRITHVGVEVSEIVPPFAHRYPSSPVVCKCSIPLVSAASEHREPDRVYGRAAHSMLCLCGRVARRGDLLSVTATRDRRAGHDRATPCGDRVAAVASAQPPRYRVRRRLPRHNRQSAVSLSNPYFHSAHGGSIVTSTLNTIRTSHTGRRSPCQP